MSVGRLVWQRQLASSGEGMYIMFFLRRCDRLGPNRSHDQEAS
jgi:hypothetical protein